MKQSNLVKLGLAALMAGMFSTSANADIIPGNATATVIVPLLLAEVTPMDFGTVAGGTTAGTITMTTGNVMGSTGGATSLATLPGTSGAFTIQGATGQAYTLTITGTARLENAAGDFMTADTFTHNAVGLSGGLDPFRVGGILNVGAGQAVGAYSTGTGGGTTFTLTANYN